MRFDQLHHQIKSIIPNGNWKLIIKRKEILLLDLIHEHNELAVEVNNMSMMMRRTIALTFLNLSLTKIVTLYLMFNTKDLVLKFFAINAFVLYFVFGMLLSYFFHV